MIKKAVFKISGMHCTSCALDIDGALEDTDGVLESNTSYAKSQTAVKFEEDKINLQRVIEIIQRVGYDALPLN